MVRCGLIGYGAWGQHHARAISSVSGAKLEAICVRSEQSRDRARAEHPQARTYTTVPEMLAREKLDLCDIVLPSHLHFDMAREVLQSGCHLLLEKPMALSLAHCTELIRLSKSQGKLLAIGHELRCSALWGKVKELIQSGAIGKPLFAQIDLWRKPYRLGTDGWRYDINRVGNWILEEPIHFFDLARWYLGENPTSVYAAANGKRADHPELQDNFSAIVNFPHGRYAIISQTLAGWEHHQNARLTGTDGAIWASWSGAMDRTFEPSFWLKVQRGESIEEVALNKPSGEVYELVDLVAAVVRSVDEGTPLPCTGEDGWWSAAMCLNSAESINAGRPISFVEA